MPVISNGWTQQKALTAQGNTGIQSYKFIPACRVFVKSADSTSAAPVNTYAAYTFKTNGTAPAAWTDLGAMQSAGKITYNKAVEKVQGGLDKITYATYIGQKDAQLEFSLSQFDDYILTQLGFNSSVITAGSTVNFQIGQEDIVTKALLLVFANKLDGKEIHWYHPAAQINCVVDEADNGIVLKVTAELTAFVASGATLNSLVSTTVFA